MRAVDSPGIVDGADQRGELETDAREARLPSDDGETARDEGGPHDFFA